MTNIEISDKLYAQLQKAGVVLGLTAEETLAALVRGGVKKITQFYSSFDDDTIIWGI